MEVGRTIFGHGRGHVTGNAVAVPVLWACRISGLSVRRGPRRCPRARMEHGVV